MVWCFVFFFFLSSLIVGGVYEAVCQKTIDSREPAYTKRVCHPSEAVEPWKPPPFAFAQVKPKLGGCLVKSAGICKEVKRIHATVHSALRTVVLFTSTKISHKEGGMFTAGLSHRSHRHTSEYTRCSKHTQSTCAPPGWQGLWQRQCCPAAHAECIGKTCPNGCVTRGGKRAPLQPKKISQKQRSCFRCSSAGEQLVVVAGRGW